MNFIDLLLIVFFLASLHGGYKRGMLQEIYDLISIVVTIFLSFILKGIAAKYVILAFDYKEIFHLNIEQGLYDIVIGMISIPLGFTFVFFVFTIIFKIVITILMKNGIIPTRTDKFNAVGSVISGLKMLVFFTVVAFLVSFTPLINKPEFYNNSLFLKPILQLNKPLYDARNELVKIIDDTKKLTAAMNNAGGLNDTKEIVAVLKDIKSNTLITDDMIASTSKALINNKEPIVLSKDQVDTFKENIKTDEKFPLLQSLYDEKIVTEELIIKVLEANEISGITKEDITDIFKKGE